MDIPKSRELIWAAEHGEIIKVQHLIEGGVDINSSDEDGRTALIAAAFNGQKDVIRYLIDLGADVNARTKAGVTVLMNAAWCGQTDMVSLLIENGANTASKLDNGFTALYFASRVSIVTQTLKLKDNVDVVRILLACGADPKIEDFGDVGSQSALRLF